MQIRALSVYIDLKVRCEPRSSFLRGRIFCGKPEIHFSGKRSGVAKLAAALLLACAFSTAAAAQSWPQKPIKMITPYPAGGGTDFIGRVAAKHLSDRLGQEVVLEDPGGATPAIGPRTPSQAEPARATHPTPSRPPLRGHPLAHRNVALRPPP